MIDILKFKISSRAKIDLAKYPTDFDEIKNSKDEARKILKNNVKRMQILQDKLYAHDRYALLIIFQAMDAAGKDSAIKHVMSGVNPQGTQVYSFKQPSKEEIDHDYLWRTSKALPERGRIGIFNRSYYEEVLVVKVHDLIKDQKIPSEFTSGDIWVNRYRQIRNFEKYIYENGTIIIKFYLHLSKDEQKQRFLKRLNTSSKNWKFSAKDLEERKYWESYQKCYEEAISETSSEYAPWYIIPADKKWKARLLISETICNTLENLNLRYPKLDEEQTKNLDLYKEKLMKD